MLTSVHKKTEGIKKNLQIVGVTTLSQVFIQFIGLISGILMIRFLPAQEYAWYTIANTFLGTMTVLSDGGISSSMMAHGGKVWSDRRALGIVFATAYTLRKRFAVLSLVLTFPFLVYLLLRQNASTGGALLIACTVVPALIASLSDNLLQIGLKLNKDVLPLQRNTLFVSLNRIFLSLPVLFLLPFAWAAILVSGIVRIMGNLRLQKLNRKWVDTHQLPDDQMKQNILSQVRRLMPGAVYYCFSGQIAIWLISIFGNHQAVASIGALGRFSVLFAVVPVLFGMLITPLFSKLSEDRTLLIRQFIQIQSGVLLGVLIVLFVFYIFSDRFLWLLGTPYVHLNYELVLSILASVTGVASGLSFSLFTSRGWSIHPFLSISVNVLSLIFGILVFQIETLHGVLLMNVFVNIIQYLMNTFFCWFKINSVKSCT